VTTWQGGDARAGRWTALALLLAAGCVRVQPYALGPALQELRDQERVVVLLDDEVHPDSDDVRKVEAEIEGCVRRALEEQGRESILLPADRFRQWSPVPPELPFRQLAQDTDELRRRSEPEIVRYVALVRTWTSQRLNSHGGLCLVIACVYTWILDRHSHIEAVILESGRPGYERHISAKASGRPVVFLAVAAPLVWPAFTRGRVCRTFAQGLSEALAERAPRPTLGDEASR
jgi:hypothetical protein